MLKKQGHLQRRLGRRDLKPNGAAGDCVHRQRLLDRNTGPIERGFPCLVAGGQWLAFVSTRDGNANIYMVNIEHGWQYAVTDDPGDDITPRWLGHVSGRFWHRSGGARATSHIGLQCWPRICSAAVGMKAIGVRLGDSRIWSKGTPFVASNRAVSRVELGVARDAKRFISVNFQP